VIPKRIIFVSRGITVLYMQVRKFLPDLHTGRSPTRCCIDTTGAPDDEHKVARNM